LGDPIVHATRRYRRYSRDNSLCDKSRNFRSRSGSWHGYAVRLSAISCIHARKFSLTRAWMRYVRSVLFRNESAPDRDSAHIIRTRYRYVLNKLRERWVCTVCFSPGKTKTSGNPVSPKIRFRLFYNFPRILIRKLSKRCSILDFSCAPTIPTKNRIIPPDPLLQ